MNSPVTSIMTSIPLLTTRLAGRLRVPIHTAPQPAFGAAVGAALLGQQQAWSVGEDVIVLLICVLSD